MKASTKENLKISASVAILLVFMLPCCLIFTDSLFLEFLGVVYTWQLWDNILKKIWKRYRATMEARDGKDV